MLCPVCKRTHDSEITQALEILKCAERITKKVKSLRAFYVMKDKFIGYLTAEGIDGIEARGFLEEFEIILKNLPAAERQFFGQEKTRIEARKMKERIIGDRVKSGELRRPKQLCPSCFRFHFFSAEIPDKCWEKAIKGDISLSFEFNKFLRENNYGELNIQ